MLTRSDLLSLRTELQTSPVLSVYLEGNDTDPAGRTAPRRTLGHRLDELRDQLHGTSHQNREEFERAATHVLEALASVSFDKQFEAWVAFATPDGLRHSALLPVRVPIYVRWAKGMRIAPYVRAMGYAFPATVVHMDSQQARLFVARDGHLDELSPIEVDMPGTPAKHMGATPRRGFHTGTRGGTGADAADRSKLVRAERLEHAVASRLLELTTPEDLIFVCGIAAVARNTASSLATDHGRRSRYLRGVEPRCTTVELERMVLPALHAWQVELEDELLRGLAEQAHADGLAVFGPVKTFAALRLGAVDSLLLSEDFLTRQLADAEDAVQLALDRHSEFAPLHGVASEHLDSMGDGIAARLRFALA